MSVFGFPQISGTPMQVEEIPAGEAGTARTIERMQQKACEGSMHPEVIALARSIVSAVPNKDYKGECQACFDWVKKFVAYRQDPRLMELVQHPYETLLVQGAGDCDDHSVAVLALCMALGHGAAFRTVKADRERPSEYSHVYPMVGFRDARNEPVWLGADTTTKGAYFGWQPTRGVWEVKDWPIAGP